MRQALGIAILIVAAGVLSPAFAQDRPTVADLQTALDEAEATLAPGQARDINLPLAKLKLKKARLLEAGGWYAGADPSGEVAEGLRLLEMAHEGNAYFPPRSVLSELAYITHNDGTVQPYYLHIPEDYDDSRAWPLIVFLHGYVPTITVVDPWVLSDEVCRIAEENGCILLIPYGRRNTDFQGVGEVDIYRAIEETQKHFNIDDARIYLSGVSMGGMGAWNMALRNPGFFAATTPISGQTDMFRWWGWDPAEMTPFKRFLVEWDNPEEMARNARGQHFFVQHGELDSLIPVIESRSMVEKFRALDIPVKYHEFEGEGHYIYWDTACYENAWGWTTDFTLERSPSHVTFRCFSLQYNRAWWLTIDRLTTWATPATVEAIISDDGAALEIECENVAALTIDLAHCPVRADGPVPVTVNGEVREVQPEDGVLRIEIEPLPEARGADEWPPLKRHGLCGPAEDAFNTPFIVVQGTAGSDEQNLELAEKVETWVDEWDRFADGRPRVTTDAELLPEQQERMNLVLFGTPETNSVLARIADRLPVAIGEREYTVLGRTFADENLGLVLAYPNPDQPDRYVLVYSGALYGRRLSINHKHDMLPDFLIFDSTRFSLADTEANVFGGWFDADWRPRPDLAWEGDIERTPQLPQW